MNAGNDIVDLLIQDSVARIVLNDPARRNALTEAMCRELCRALKSAAANAQVAVVLIEGAPPAFCAGGDIKAMQSQSDLFRANNSLELMNSYRTTIQQIPLTLLAMDKPVIAIIDGPAIGAGFDLACFCDLRVASRRARFAESFGRLGLISGIGGAFALTRWVGLGYSQAADLALTGRQVDPEEAFALGLVNRLCNPNELDSVTNNLVADILRQPPEAARAAKRLLRHALRGELEDHLNYAAALQGCLQRTEEHLACVDKALASR